MYISIPITRWTFPGPIEGGSECRALHRGYQRCIPIHIIPSYIACQCSILHQDCAYCMLVGPECAKLHAACLVCILFSNIQYILYMQYIGCELVWNHPVWIGQEGPRSHPPQRSRARQGSGSNEGAGRVTSASLQRSKAPQWAESRASPQFWNFLNSQIF